VELKTSKVTQDIDSAEDQATMQVIHLEQPSSKADVDAVTQLLDSMFQKRTKLSGRPNPHEPEDTPLEGLGAGVDDSV
jgi:hypothetical protein